MARHRKLWVGPVSYFSRDELVGCKYIPVYRIDSSRFKTRTNVPRSHRFLKSLAAQTCHVVDVYGSGRICAHEAVHGCIVVLFHGTIDGAI